MQGLAVLAVIFAVAFLLWSWWWEPRKLPDHLNPRSRAEMFGVWCGKRRAAFSRWQDNEFKKSLRHDF